MQSGAATLPFGGVSTTTLGGRGGEVHGMLAGLGSLALRTSWSCPSICESASLERWRCSGICSGCSGCQSRAAPDVPFPPPPPAVARTPAEFDASALETASLDLNLRRVLKSRHRATEENGSGATGGSWDPEGPPPTVPPLPSLPPSLPPLLPPSPVPSAPPASPPPLTPSNASLDLPAPAPPVLPSPVPPTAPPLPAQPPPPPPPAPIAIVSFSLLVSPAAAEAGSGAVATGRRRRLAVSGSELQSAVLQAMQGIDEDFDEEFGAGDVDVDGPTSGDDGDTFGVNVTVHGATDPSATAAQVAASVSSATFGATLASYFPADQSLEVRVTVAPTILLVDPPEPEDEPADDKSKGKKKGAPPDDNMDVIWAVGIPASFCACALLSTLCCFSCYKRHGKIAELEAKARKHDMEPYP